ncbi:alpha/beta hydrolase [Actinotalea sp. BY-33]|uniref:Alpha/beta hydrolase n=1 Tax=Actinotalea soli TaxID=2819234 RepID=A0A939RWM3_9CELL|nr:alpha/beta hydrolase [Actinotalea soli]MBO1752768.1 alpha/beta hydrolase [Actinotalea soli]
MARDAGGRGVGAASPWRRAGLVLVAALAVVAVLIGLFWALQRQLMYHPDATPVGEVADRVDGAEDVVLQTEDGLDLGAWLVPPQGGDRETAVLYLPGNGGNRAGRLETAQAIAAHGFTVLLVDYRGYGGNPGSPSEEGLAHDARAAVALLRDRGFEPARTLYVGESIGTGVASGLVVTDPPAGVLLRSPFTSFAEVVDGHAPFPARRLVRDEYPSAADLRSSDVPVTILYGDADGVVPPRLSAELATQVPNLVDEVVVPGAGHNDSLWFGEFLAEAVVALADVAVSD